MWSLGFALAALLLTAAAFWHARHQWAVLNRWKPVTGTLLSREVPRNHDSDGYLDFEISTVFRYPVDGKPKESSALSFFHSSDFGWISPRALAYQVGSQYPLRYDPARPEVFEFGVGYTALYFRRPLLLLSAAAACLLLGLSLRRLSKPPKRCVQCNRTVRSFFRYCPECGESISGE